MAFKKFIFLYFLAIVLSVNSLQLIDDDTLMDLIRNEKYLIVLFSTQDCQQCENYEEQLENVKKELEDELNAKTIKVLNSQLNKLYSPTKEPALVFFRHGIPLLYDREVNGDLIVHTFASNKEPTVKELTDETFEHLTQAATGATTGDWFVMFYSPPCVDCHRLQARWEAVGAHLKTRMNVARVNIATDGRETAERFKVEQVPSFILFRQGKYYRYHLKKYDIASFKSFAQEWYKNLKPERVPSPQTPFDKLVGSTLRSFQENSIMWQSLLGVGIGAVIIIIIKMVRKNNTDVNNSNKEKQK